MAYDWLIGDDFRFSGDPFVYGGKKWYGNGGWLPDYDPSQGPILGESGDQSFYYTPQGIDYWAASPELAARDSRWNDWTQSEVVGAGDGWYDVKLKSGDKEGSIVRIQQDPATGEWVSGGVRGTVGWNTNSPAIPPGMAAVIAAPFLVGGAQSLGLLGQGATSFPVGVGELASFGPEFVGLGGASAAGGASSAAQQGSFLNSLLQQSTPIEASMSAAQSAAPGFLSETVGMSLPAAGAFGGAFADAASGALGSAAANAAKGAASGASEAAKGGASDIINKVTEGGLGALDWTDWAKIIGTAGAGIGSYLDAKDKDGQSTGDPVSTGFLRGHMGTNPLQNRQQMQDFVSRGPQFQPTFTTGLLNLPPAGQRTGYKRSLIG